MSDAEQNEYLSDPAAAGNGGSENLTGAGSAMPPRFSAAGGPQAVGPEAAPGPAGRAPSAQEPLPPAGAVPPAGTGTPPPVRTGDVSDDDRLLSALCWVSMVIFQIPLLSVVLLLAEPNKNRPFQRYHAVQSIGFWVAAVVYEILLTVVTAAVAAVTFGCGAACLFPLIFLPHIVALYYAYESFVGRRPAIPWLSEFMRQQGWA